MPIVDTHLTAVFLEEAERCFARLESGLRLAEAGTQPGDDLWRSAHAIGGRAATMGYTTIASIATVLERLSRKLCHGTDDVTPGLLQLMRVGLDTIGRELEQLQYFVQEAARG